MASLADGYTMGNDAAFINRVSEAVAQNAYNIITTEEDTVENHDLRLALAIRVAQDVNAYGYRFARMVAANPSIATHAPDGAAVPDGDIAFAVNAVWEAFQNV